MRKITLFSLVFFTQGKIRHSPIKAFSNNAKGFTLPELLLAASILAFALSSILLAFISCFFLNEMNRNLSLATTHGEFVLEEVKNTNFSTVKNCVGINSTACWDWGISKIRNETSTSLPNESVDTTVTEHLSNLLDVAVVVSWKDRGIRDRNVILETLIAQP
jgi:prepilin-type N-terminal cleavage/methylation domain-containing protein